MRVRCVGAIIHDAEGRLLLIRRGRPPGEGLWSIPGGRAEGDESDADAVVREVAEETGLRVVPGPLAGSVHRPGPGGVTYDIRDYRATVTGGELRAGDDARDARWVAADELAALPTSPGLVEALASWGVLPTGG
jgi:8-oxo-dGTP diphosphatase